MNQAVQSEGHVYLEGEIVLPEVKRLLEMSQPVEIPFSQYFRMRLLNLLKKVSLSAEGQRLYMPSLYFSEIGFASKIESDFRK